LRNTGSPFRIAGPLRAFRDDRRDRNERAKRACTSSE